MTSIFSTVSRKCLIYDIYNTYHRAYDYGASHQRTDRLGHIQVKPEHRETLLDKSEQSGVSALQFTKMHGVKYTTFANWRQKRSIKIGQYPKDTPAAPCELIDSLSEVVVQSHPATIDTPQEPLLIESIRQTQKKTRHRHPFKVKYL